MSQPDDILGEKGDPMERVDEIRREQVDGAQSLPPSLPDEESGVEGDRPGGAEPGDHS